MSHIMPHYSRRYTNTYKSDKERWGGWRGVIDASDVSGSGFWYAEAVVVALPDNDRM